jgi:hypothetical protein
MALTDVINRLAEVNEDQLVETQHVRVEIESLSDRVTELLEFNKQDRLERLEQMRESARAFEAPSMTGGDAGVGAAGKGGGFNLPGIGGLGRALAGFFGLTGFLATLSVFGGRLLTLFRVVGRFLGPLGVVITAIIGTFAAVEGFIKGYEEGGILGGLEGAVKGFFGAIVAAPLDLVREAAAWIAMQLGFAKVSTFLKSFSFAAIYDQLITSIFDGVERVFDSLNEIFTFPEDGDKLGALGNLIDIVYLPVNMAVNFVQGMFGWDDPDEPFRLSKFISDSIKSGMNHALSVFGFEPVDTEQTLMNFLMETFDNVFASITQVVTDFGKRLLIEGEIVFRRILTFIQNIPDQLMKFISDTLSFKLPPIIIPNPIPKPLRRMPGAPKEDGIVLFAGTDEIRIPGGENAAANIAERNAALEADIARLQAQITVAPNTSGMVLEGMNGAAGQTGGVQVVPVPVPQPQPMQGPAGAAVSGDQNVSSSTAAEVPNHYMGMHPDLVYSGSMPTSR